MPVNDIGEWIETGERDEELGLNITEWTGEYQNVNVADCPKRQQQREALFAGLEAMEED